MKESKTLNNTPFTAVSSANPVAPYVGGKRNLAKKIISKISEIPHLTYVEPFVGMGGVFLRRPFKPKAEVINDYDDDVANLFRILQRHYVPFLEMLKWRITSRSEFERLNKTDPQTLTDLERAARFLYLQRLAFGGKSSGRSFGISRDRPASFNFSNIAPILEEVYERLSGVIIECQKWQKILERYDKEGTLFYLDPPYFGTEAYYQAAFKREEFQELADALKNLKGRFIMSINDCYEIRKMFSMFKLEEVSLNYSLNGKHAKKAGELIISN